MAERNNKYKDNVTGVYYVDKKCISCAACVGVANDFFKMNYDEQHAIVKKQPSTPEEAEICIQALERCPVEAIGNDGYLDLKIVQALNINISYNILQNKHLTNKFIKPNFFFIILLITVFNTIFFNLPSLAKVTHKQVSVKFIKLIEKPKMIFYSNGKNEKKISYPPKVIYSVNDYYSNPFTTTIGLPASYKMLPGNRYVVYQNFYASGGSGSMANLYLLDLQTPRVWHLGIAETVAGDYPEYVLSTDKQQMVFYQNQFYSPVIFMKMNKKNSPYISEVITKEGLEKLLNKTFSKKYEISNINAEYKNNNFELTTISNITNEKTYKNENHKLIFDTNKNKITKISIFSKKEQSYNWEKLHMDENQFDYEKENALSSDKKFVKVYFYKDSGSSPVKRQYFLQILRMSDYKVIYENTRTKTLENDSANDTSSIFYLNWLNNYTSVLKISGEDTYILNINDSGDKVNSVKNNELEYISSDNLSPDAKFALFIRLKNQNNEKSGEILKLIRMKDNKTIFSSETFNTSTTSFQWISNHQVIFFDKSGHLHILKISSNGDSIEDSLVKNFPALSKKEKINRNILSNQVNSAICIVSDNNLYWLDLNKLETVKITDFNFNFKYNKYSDVEFSDIRPQVSMPYIYITPDGKRIFYGLLPNDYNAKLMSVKLKN